MLRAGNKRRMTMPSLLVPPTKKGPRKHSKDAVDTLGNLDTKQLIVPTRKATKKGPEIKNSSKKSNMAKGTPKQMTFRYVQN